jgi:hypothetical protein
MRFLRRWAWLAAPLPHINGPFCRSRRCLPHNFLSTKHGTGPELDLIRARPALIIERGFGEA